MRKIVFLIAAFCALAAASPKKERVSPIGSYLTVPANAPTIILDPGHGGTDLGARAKPPYCEEKKICLQTARLLKAHLNQLGYRVVMTRDSDAFIPLPRRVEIATQATGDLYVSVHFNSTRNPIAQGIEIFYCENWEEKSRTRSAQKLADLVLSKLIKNTEAVSRGVKRGNFYVIREAPMPAILIEGGFISNPEERTQLKTRAYQEKIAHGIAEGIDAFLKKR